MKPTPNLLDVEAGVDTRMVIALLAPQFNPPVFETFCPREKVG